MRSLRFIFITLTTFLLATSAVFWRKAIAVLLCGILSLNSASCYDFLKRDDNRAYAAESSLQISVNLESDTPVSSADILLTTKAKQADLSDKDISLISREAARNNKANCSGSVRQVAKKLGITLGGQQANDQINWLEEQVVLKKWRKVGKDEAAVLAADNKFVVVGLREKRNGHIAVVVKGTSDRGYPTIAGGALYTIRVQQRTLANGRVVQGGVTSKLSSDGKPTYTAYSEGGLTVNYAWNSKVRDNVSYYTENPCGAENTQKSKQSKFESDQSREECKLKEGKTYGDPHIATFDGMRYSFQTVGEFILSKSNDGAFEVQTRQAPVKPSLSLNSAVAMKVDGDRVALYSKDFPDANTSTPLRINGKPTTIEGDKLALPKGGEILKQGKNYVVNFSTGEKVVVSSISTGGNSYFNVSPFVYNRSGKYSGLLGNVNGNPNDDQRVRGKENSLDSKSTYGDVKQVLNLAGLRVPGALSVAEKLYFDQLYKEFGNSWRVKQEESLFDYPAGKTTKNYVDPAFPDKYLTLNMLSADQIQKAQNACTEANVTQDLMEGCIFDVGFSGFSEFARATAEVNGYVGIVNQLIPGLNIPTTGQVVDRVIEKIKPKICLPLVGCL